MRRVIITGGAGFIGSHLVDSLLKEGYKVAVIDNFDPFYSPEIKRQNIAHHFGNPNFILIEADIRDMEALERSIKEDNDLVVHLAAKAGVRHSLSDPLGYEGVNIKGTLNLLELCRERGIKKFVFASSSSVYGLNSKVPWREDDTELKPISPYGATKLAGEFLGHVYSQLYGIKFIALRIFTAYGPRQRPDLAIHKFARLMLEEKPIPIYGDGSRLRDYTYIDDLIMGIRAAMEYEGSFFELVNLGSGWPISLIEVVRGFEEILGIEARMEFLPPQPGDPPQTCASLEKAQRLLGYTPQLSFKEGLRRFSQWLKKTLICAC